MVRKTSEHTQKVQRYFEARVDDYDAFYDSPSAFWRGFNRVFRKAVVLRRDEVAALAQRFGCTSLLDVGCGSGRNTIWWARHGLERLHGVDVSDQMIQEARGLADRADVGDRCTFELADFMAWTTDQTYEMVVACGVFDYVVDPEAFLRRMATVGTRVIYGSFPGWTLVRTPLRKVRYMLRGCPTRFYRRAQIEAIFNQVGFGRLEIKRVPSGHLAWAARA